MPPTGNARRDRAARFYKPTSRPVGERVFRKEVRPWSASRADKCPPLVEDPVVTRHNILACQRVAYLVSYGSASGVCVVGGSRLRRRKAAVRSRTLKPSSLWHPKAVGDEYLRIVWCQRFAIRQRRYAQYMALASIPTGKLAWCPRSYAEDSPREQPVSTSRSHTGLVIR